MVWQEASGATFLAYNDPPGLRTATSCRAKRRPPSATCRPRSMRAKAATS
ncbi:hypothetical protein OZ411_13245 [Bradyrhizobium sp. Arg237L]|nr:hypothetical protein [Bradyrhizobium sp. Arg237L]MDI4233779.1 hypothetical protein [Bradyrhizobium sp. Arg237L]